MEAFDAFLAHIDSSYAAWFAPISLPLSDFFSLQHLPTHFPTIVFAVCFYQLIFFLGGALSPLFSAHYRDERKLSKKTRYQWKVKCVSQANSILVVWMSAQVLDIAELERDRAFGWDERVGRLCAMSCGYFLWDVIETLYADAGIPFLIHGVACLSIFGMGFRPFIAYYGARSLLWEVSTPFLNIHWWLDKTERTGSVYQMINGAILISTFFGFRIVYGSWITWNFWRTLYAVRSQFSTTTLVFYVVGNASLNVLNWIWLSKMISALLKRFTAKEDATKTNGAKAIHKVVKEGKDL